jgi:hypothetical protein
VQTVISSPVELLKIRMQLQQAMPGTPGYVGSLGMLRSIVAAEGWPGERGAAGGGAGAADEARKEGGSSRACGLTPVRLDASASTAASPSCPLAARSDHARALPPARY